MAVILCLVLTASIASPIGHSHAAQKMFAGASIADSDGMQPANAPCPENATLDVDQDCVFAAGCALYLDAQRDFTFAPAGTQLTACTLVEFYRDTAAIPQAPPPKFTAQV